MRWVLFASISGLIAAGTPMVDTTLGEYGQLGAAAMLGIITIILVARTIPKMVADFVGAMKEIREQAHDDSVNLNKTLTDLRVHCVKRQDQ
jgi:hypothetical protein